MKKYSELLYPYKTNVFRGILVSACLSLHPSVCPSMYPSMFKIGVLSQTPSTVLLLLYWKFVDILIVFWSCARQSFQPSTPYDSKVISPWTYKIFVKVPISVKVLAWYQISDSSSLLWKHLLSDLDLHCLQNKIKVSFMLQRLMNKHM